METLSAVLFFTAVAVYMLWFSRLARTLTGPRVWPLLGSLPGLVRNCHRMHDWILENLRVCGGTYQTTTFAVPLIARKAALTTVTCDPRNLEHILKSRFDNYPKGPTWHAVFHDLLGDGIFNSDGDTWLFQRKTAALEFTTRTLRQAMSRWVTRAIHGRLLPIMQEASKRCGAGEQGGIDLQDLLLRLTFDNICGLAFGKDPETLAAGLPENAFASAFDRATEASLHRFILPAFMWKLKKWLKLGMEVTLADSVSHVEEYLSGVINARKHELAAREQQLEGSFASPKQQQHDDLLSRFMKKGSYEDTFLQHVALNFILAGRDTSSVALSWFFWLMTIHKDVEEKILYEICTVLADTRGVDDPSSWVSDPLSYDEADRLVYLKAALSETLRLYPSVPQDSKHVVADDILPDGTFVPAGSAITYSIYSAGRMKSIWGDNCLDFCPDRWLSPDGTRFVPMDQFKFVAFNAGPRICLGKDLAYLQMKSIAAAVLLRHRLEVAPGHRVEQKMSLTLFMKYGLRVNVHRRDLSGVADRVKTARSAAAGVVEGKEKPVDGSDDASAVGVNGGSQGLVGVGGAGVMVASVA